MLGDMVGFGLALMSVPWFVQNLTTRIDMLEFNHDTQMLAMGSRMKKDALKMVCGVPRILLLASLYCIHIVHFGWRAYFLHCGGCAPTDLGIALLIYPW